MSAEILRRAAALMRERAQVGPDHPWSLDGGDQVVARYTVGEVVIADYVLGGWADHIASWHPAVAFAVADWLEGAAEARKHTTALDAFLIDRERDAAIAVARAYLGESA